MIDLERLNSWGPRRGSRGDFEREGDRDDLTKFAREDNLSLRDSDDTTIEEPEISFHTRSHSHTQSHLSRTESKKTYVDFVHNDPENPLNFSTAKKWFITGLAVMITILVAAAAGAYAPAMPNLIEEFGCSSEIATLGISLYPLGCISSDAELMLVGIAPLVLAPLSELQGRNPVYYITVFITAS
jgi:hypothetical protein